MDFKVIFRDTFIEDLERIVRSIAIHNPDAARKLGEIIIARSESLRFFPERHPRIHQRPTIRRFVVRKYSRFSTERCIRRQQLRFCDVGMDGKGPHPSLER